MRSDGILIILGNIDLMNDLFQRRKVLLDRLIHKNIAVSKVKDLSFQPTSQQTINNLKSGICFPRTGRHNQQ